jgi:hypothetical protein
MFEKFLGYTHSVITYNVVLSHIVILYIRHLGPTSLGIAKI